MRKVSFIGDIHGDWTRYKLLVDQVETSVQVGDFGYGFIHKADEYMLEWQKEHPQHRFIRGNHDDPNQCLRSPTYIPDGFMDHQNGIMYIGGAWSIDYAMRKEGCDWWPDEECSTRLFEKLFDLYLDFKPRMMVTHDAPLKIPRYSEILSAKDFQMVTRTGLWLERMRYSHKPELWMFGHWHKSADKQIEGTRFICLNINEVKTVDLDTLEVT